MEGTHQETSERTAVSPMTWRCGACQQELVLSQAQRRWIRCHPDSHVFCNTKCCNRHYQRLRQRQPGGRQAEYQRTKLQRSGIAPDGPGVIHATDQDYLGGGWSSIELPSYGAYRCTCRPQQECASCRAWRG